MNPEQIIEKRKEKFRKHKDIIFILLMFALVVACGFTAYYLMQLPTNPCELCMEKFGMSCFSPTQFS